VDTSYAVLIPLLNPNEPEAAIAALHIQEGQTITQGDLLCTLETTKSTVDLASEMSGYVIHLGFNQGDIARAGDTLCYIAPDPEWRPPVGEIQPLQSGEATKVLINGDPSIIPEGLRITQPALALAEQNGVDLGKLPQDRLMTESLLRTFLEVESGHILPNTPGIDIDPTAVIIYGGGGHGKALIDLVRILRVYHIVGILDDGIPSGETIMDLPVLGGEEVLPTLFDQGVRLAINAVGGIGDLTVREKVFRKLAQAGFSSPAVVHPTSFIEPSASLSPGVQIFPHAYIGSQASIGFGCIINTNAILSHDCILNDLANISPGAVLAGEVQIGAGVLVGMGATINLQVKIGAGARIGNGATVKEDVPEKGIVRAGTIWPE
jgi:sugar O-acyltransferase (sialic acid O-acetyltransferase NeuD family)